MYIYIFMYIYMYIYIMFTYIQYIRECETSACMCWDNDKKHETQNLSNFYIPLIFYHIYTMYLVEQ